MTHRILFSISVLIALSSCSSPLDSYQRDSDIYRMRHLVNYGELIQEFHAKTGRYPFQGLSDKTINVCPYQRICKGKFKLVNAAVRGAGVLSHFH